MASLNACVSRDELLDMQKKVEAVKTSEPILSYIVQLTEVTRDNDLYSLGLSPRASIALLKMARARAFTLDRDYVVPEDVKAVYFAIANHRVILSTKAKATGYTLEMALAKSFDSVKLPG